MRTCFFARFCFLSLFGILQLFFSTSLPGQIASESAPSPLPAVTEQRIYVPVYSHIFHGNTPRPFDLTTTLSIRNTDPKRTITILSTTYYDSEGKLVREYLEKPVLLAPLASTYCLIPESDSTGGVGAVLLVHWKSKGPVNPPLVESVMIGTRGQQGISFTSRGQVLQD